MKEMYLGYNPYSGYIFVDGSDYYQENRKNLGHIGEGKLIRKLDSLVQQKRKSLLHLVNIPEELTQKIKDKLSDTKVSIDIKDNFEEDSEEDL